MSAKTAVASVPEIGTDYEIEVFPGDRVRWTTFGSTDGTGQGRISEIREEEDGYCFVLVDGTSILTASKTNGWWREFEVIF